MAQERRVLLANGQYITIVQTTGTSSGDVMSQSAVTTALSTKSDIGHTHNASSITGGTFGTARIADGAVTTVKVADGAITKAKLGSDISLPSVSYETVKVSGLTPNGTAAIGAEVTIGGDLYRFDSTGVVSAQIPYGQAYKIQTYTNNAWLGGYEAIFTANTESRTISITYFGANGVYIEATDGMLYTSNNWDSGKTANSIVVSSDVTKFRIALTQSSSSMTIYNTNNPTFRYSTQIRDAAQALSDYNGARNTADILLSVPSANYAAGWCDAFIFPDGKTKGFLPSLGQLNLAYQNRDAVNAALSKCGGAEMYITAVNNMYQSSTYFGYAEGSNPYYAFWTHYNNGGCIYINQTYPCSVRPFADYSI